MDKRVSVVIPSYQGVEFLKENLPHVIRLGATEIIIVNDFSPDETSLFITKNYPQIKLVSHMSNVGFPQSVNDGFNLASGDYILLLNQDATPDPNLITYALDHFQKNPHLFAVTFNDSQNSWATATLKKGFIEYGNGGISRTHSSFWASGAAGVYDKNIWVELGGLDPIFSPGYHEDQDLGFRAHKSGFEIIWDPKCKISHTKPGSTFSKKYSPKKLKYYKERNYLILHWKNLDGSNLLSHFIYLLWRIITKPGFIVPFLFALSRLYQVISARELNNFVLSDEEVFAKFKSNNV